MTQKQPTVQDRIRVTKDYSYTFTVFTPTYNRRHTLHRVYESLVKQSFRDFEWIVVDDGSTDDTEGVVREWQKTASFPIIYLYQENAGKHNAINAGVKQAEGAFFLIADSDDSFLPTTLQVFYDTWQTIPTQERDKYAGIWCLCQDEQGQIVPKTFPQDVWDCTLEERVYKYKISGEKWHVERTDIMRQFPFPNIRLKRFYYPEGIIWAKMNQTYLFRCINEPLRVYHRNDNSIMANINTNPTNSLSMYVSIEAVLNNEISYFRYSPLLFIEYVMLFIKYSIELKISLIDSFKKLIPLSSKALFAVFFCLTPLILLASKMRRVVRA